MSIGAITPIRPIGPPEGHALKWSLPPHVKYRVISPRNVQFVAGLNLQGCAACHAEVQVRHLIGYRGHKFCPACFTAAATHDHAEANARLARPTLAARVRVYFERTGARHEIVPDADLAYRNCPEECP